MMMVVAHTAQVEKLLTIEDLEKMPDDAMHRELVEGELIELPPPAYIHVLVAHRIYELLKPFVTSHGLGRVLIELGWVVRSDRRTWIQPDVSFFRADRMDSQDLFKLPEGVPDLAVEVISPSERPKHIKRKRDFLLSSGTQEVWTVYPRRRTVEIYCADGTIRVLHENDEITSPLFPGWSARGSQFFED
jgi:Uma2 family endonuclease